MRGRMPILYKAKGMNTLVFDKNGLDRLQKVSEVSTADEVNKKIEMAYDNGYSDGMDKLRCALCDKEYLKANYGTTNWLEIIHDFAPGTIVKEWKEYHENQKQEQKEPSFRVGDRVKMETYEGTIKGIVTHVNGLWITFLMDDGRTHYFMR